jgi:site-specific DNA-methyltransferase (adenine-specific)
VSRFQLYLADAIDLMRALPSESVDLIVTDVAYESLEKHRATGTTTRLKQSAGSSNEWFPIFGNERFVEFFDESFRVLKKDAHLYFYCDEDTADVAKPIGRAAGFKFWKSLVWVKTRQNTKPDADDLVVEHQAMLMGYHYRGSKEFVLFFEKGKRKLSDLSVRDVLPFPVVRNGYPTEKPVDLNKVFIRLSSLPGETVLDPFMGSASTGVAAMKLGRDFIGGDVKDTAVAAADVRLKANEGVSRGDVIALAASAERPARPEPPPKKKRAKRVTTAADFVMEVTRTPEELDAALDEAVDEEDAERIVAAHQPPGEEALKRLQDPPVGLKDLVDGLVERAPQLLQALSQAVQPSAQPRPQYRAGDVVPTPQGEMVVIDTPHGLALAPKMPDPATCEHAFMGKPRMCGKCGARDDLPLVTTDAPLPPIGALEPAPKLDGMFMTGPLPGGPSRHLPRAQLIPPPRVANFCRHGDTRASCPLCVAEEAVASAPLMCRHNEPRTECVLCRARR